MRIGLYLILGSLVFTSCDKPFYIESFSFEEGWKKQDNLNFNIEIQEPTKDYNIQFVIRHNNDYPFRNIILFTELEHDIDTLSYELATKDGRWLGHGFGAEKELKLEYKKNYHFKEKGLKNLKIVQAMRKDTLKGIKDFSVIINTKN